MKFSIIIPLYNKGKGILRSINSIINQSYNDFELIIVNDGSTDDSVQNVKIINDKRISIYNQINSGPSAARNKGISLAKGDWILFLDADDELLPNALETFNSLICKYPLYSVFCCNHILENNGFSRVRANYYPDGIVSNNYRAWFFNLLLPCQGCTLFKRDVLERYKYPNYIRRWEDAALMFEIMREYQIVRSHIPTFIYHRSMSEGMFPRKNIDEDYGAHLSFSNKTFWEKMCLYKLLTETRKLYPTYNLSYPTNSIGDYIIPLIYVVFIKCFDFLSYIKKTKNRLLHK